MTTDTDRKEQLVRLRFLLDRGAISGAEFDRLRRELSDLPPGEPVDLPEDLFELARARRGVVEVEYRSLGRVWVAALVFFGIGVSFVFVMAGSSNGIRAVLAPFAVLALAYGGFGAWGLIRASRSHGYPLVVDEEGFSVCFPLQGLYRVPWSEVEGCQIRESHGEYFDTESVEIKLRAPAYRFSVSAAHPRLLFRRRRLVIGESLFEVSNEHLVELIQGHITKQTHVGATT